MSRRLLVLAWHNVEPTWCFPARSGAGRRGLQEQLAFLARFANVIPLRDGLHALSEGSPLPARAVAITFDDGYRDQLELAVPMLEHLGLPATFFLISGLLDGTVRPWWEVLGWIFMRATRDGVLWEGRTVGLRGAAERRASLYRVSELLKRRDGRARDEAIEQFADLCRPAGSPRDQAMFMDWVGARELARRGFTVGSHSQSHAILANEHEAEQRRDLSVSRRQLTRELGVTVDLLGYPNGTALDYDQTTVRAARDAGYTHALTTIAGWNDPSTTSYDVRRFVLQPERGVAGLSIVPLNPVWRRVRQCRDHYRGVRTDTPSRTSRGPTADGGRP
jgi:peptidoglycan/xylan/chitin deacetylase (PgdA/CDA1 family)